MQQPAIVFGRNIDIKTDNAGAQLGEILAFVLDTSIIYRALPVVGTGSITLNAQDGGTNLVYQFQTPTFNLNIASGTTALVPGTSTVAGITIGDTLPYVTGLAGGNATLTLNSTAALSIYTQGPISLKTSLRPALTITNLADSNGNALVTMLSGATITANSIAFSTAATGSGNGDIRQQDLSSVATLLSPSVSLSSTGKIIVTADNPADTGMQLTAAASSTLNIHTVGPVFLNDAQGSSVTLTTTPDSAGNGSITINHWQQI